MDGLKTPTKIIRRADLKAAYPTLALPTLK
jgi:hypothetical protein